MSIVYTLTVERAGGCTSIDEVKVDLEPSQGAFFNINTPGYTNMPCEGDNVSLVTPNFPNGSYVWTKDSVSIPTATPNQHDIIGLQTADAGYYKAVVTYGRCSSEGGILIDPGLCGGALAVQLSSFSVNCNSDGGAIVEWVTASETNSLDYVISKSRDMAQWTLVDTVKGLGFSNTNVEYALFDSSPYQGLSYYKLTQRDIDGTEEVFPIISNFCNLDRENQMEIYPNPSNGEFNIDIHLNESINCQIAISDISGRVMSLKNHELKKGSNTLIYSSSLMRGVYIVRLLENNSSISSKKLIIE